MQAKCLESMQAETAQQESCEAALASHQVVLLSTSLVCKWCNDMKAANISMHL